jgi:hypothetical protein
MTDEDILSQFRNERYEALNAVRWAHFLSLEISLEGKTIFEPGAGVGDQTAWLLNQGAKLIYVSDGRFENLAIIAARFIGDLRLAIIPGDLEFCLVGSQFRLNVDFIFCYGVYYHLKESSDFRIMRELSAVGQTIAFDFLAGNDNEVSYGYDNPSTSISGYGFRPRPESLVAALKEIWGYAYLPKEQLKWIDPVQAEQRMVAIASHAPLRNPNLIRQ